MLGDHEIDAAVAEVDVDAAFDDVVGRFGAEQRRHRFQRVLVAAACVLAIVGVAWIAWPADDDQSQRVDQVGEPLPPVDTEQTPASATGITETGLRVTLSVADDVIPVGGSTAVEVTIANESDETFNGGWVRPFECAQPNVTTLVITSPEGAPFDGLDDASAWDGPDEPIGPVVLTEGAMTWGRTPTYLPGSVGPHGCLASRDMRPIDPGQAITSSGTWDAWFSPGALPNDGQLMVTVNAVSASCGPFSGDCSIDAGSTVQVDVPITVDDRSRPAPPSATALAASAGRADVQVIIDGMDPASPYQPRFSASLVQVGQQWLLTIQRGGLAAHVWFAGDAVLEVQRKQTGDPFTPPDQPAGS